MVNTTVRIESIEIKNFKNVGYGHLDFESEKKSGRASILGLYGQNGSGKTALIDALELLRLALSGSTIPAYLADYINVDSLVEEQRRQQELEAMLPPSERSAPKGSSFGVAQEAPAPRPTIDDLPDDVKRMLGQL